MIDWKLIGSNLEAYQFQSNEHEIALESISAVLPSDYAGLRRTFNLDLARGKRLQFSAYICTDNATNAGLWLKANAKSLLVSDAMYDCLLSGTQDWTHKALVIDVPLDASSLTYGLWMMGSGKCAMKKVSVKFVGQDVATTSKNYEQIGTRFVESP